MLEEIGKILSLLDEKATEFMESDQYWHNTNFYPNLKSPSTK
jgi:hypothetical protein